MEGWIQLHRKFLEWEWFNDSKTVHLFIYLLIKANHKDNKWRGVLVKRGQLISGLESISRDTGLSIQNIRTRLKRLEKTGEIHRQTNRHYSVIIVLKYEYYNNKKDKGNTPTNKQLTNNQQTANKQVTTNNNVNNEKNVNNENRKGLTLHFSTKEFLKAWQTLMTTPKWKKKTNVSLQVSLDKLAKYDEDFAIELIKNATAGGWQGVVFSDTDQKFKKWKAEKKKKHLGGNVNALWE